MNTVLNASLLGDKGLRGDASLMEQLIYTYTGNPLALKLVAQGIHEVFDGDLAAFFRKGVFLIPHRGKLAQSTLFFCVDHERLQLHLCMLARPYTMIYCPNSAQIPPRYCPRDLLCSFAGRVRDRASAI